MLYNNLRQQSVGSDYVSHSVSVSKPDNLKIYMNRFYWKHI